MSAKPHEFPVVEMVGVVVRDVGIEKPNSANQSRAMRCANVKLVINEKIKNFNFCPYTYIPRGVPAIQFDGKGWVRYFFGA